jgi:hypothetical protein
MGMDVYGRQPRSERGKYFRASVWSWRPIATLSCAAAPDITAGCKHWQSNDGDGLEDGAARALGRIIQSMIDSGLVAELVAKHAAALEAMADEPCASCGATGVRSDAVGVKHGWPDKPSGAPPGHPRHGAIGSCNSCQGKGTVRPIATWYSMDVEHIREWAAFLEDCGGFEIC